MKSERRTRAPEETRRKLIDATIRLVLKQGFNATTVDQICTEAGVTKGSFFHHFEGKDAIGLEAVRTWGAFGTSMYSAAWKEPSGALEEIHRLLDIMTGFTERDDPCVCVVGMMSQEMSRANPSFQEACSRELETWTEMMRSRLEQAKAELKPALDFDPSEVAWFLNSLWQGGMLIAKTQGNPGLLRANLRLARAYVDSLFTNERVVPRGASLIPF